MLFSPGEPLPAAVETTPDSAAPGPGIPGHLFAISLALIGGVLGILGAVVQEMRTGGFLLLFFLGAPIIEEGLKPAGVYILLARWPRLECQTPVDNGPYRSREPERLPGSARRQVPGRVCQLSTSSVGSRRSP